MGRLEPPTRAEAELRRIMDWRDQATEPEDRAEAEDALTHLLRMYFAGRIDEYFANRDEQASVSRQRP